MWASARSKCAFKDKTLSKQLFHQNTALLRYTQWASQSHDKTFLVEFIVESRASSLNEFLTLRESRGRKLQTHFRLHLCHFARQSCEFECEKHCHFLDLSCSLRPFLISHDIVVFLHFLFFFLLAHLILFQLLNASIRVFRAQFHLLYSSHIHKYTHRETLFVFPRLSHFLDSLTPCRCCMYVLLRV